MPPPLPSSPPGAAVSNDMELCYTQHLPHGTRLHCSSCARPSSGPPWHTLVSWPLADGLASLERIVHLAGVGAPAVPAGLVPRADQLRWRGGGGGAEEELGSRAGRRCVIPCGRTQG